MLVGEEETGAGGGGDKHRKETDVDGTCHLAQNDRRSWGLGWMCLTSGGKHCHAGSHEKQSCRKVARLQYWSPHTARRSGQAVDEAHKLKEHDCMIPLVALDCCFL